jgi:hypothetical protein
VSHRHPTRGGGEKMQHPMGMNLETHCVDRHCMKGRQTKGKEAKNEKYGKEK